LEECPPQLAVRSFSCCRFFADSRTVLSSCEITVIACLFFQDEIKPHDLAGFRENGPAPIAHLSHEVPPE
jgi:hypothetical protein